MSRGPDAHTLLERALLASAERHGCPLAVTASDMTRWASATFAGARHRLSLGATASAGLDQWIAALPEAELGLRGHLLADAVVAQVRRAGDSVTIEAEFLTIEEAPR
jgi:hypothetical protein